jgi:hypothetical protein
MCRSVAPVCEIRSRQTVISCGGSYADPVVRRCMRTVAPAAQGTLSRTMVNKLVVYITLHLMVLL